MRLDVGVDMYLWLDGARFVMNENKEMDTDKCKREEERKKRERERTS